MEEQKSYEWPRGGQARFAKYAEMTPSWLNDILHQRPGRCVAGPKLAPKLVRACERMREEVDSKFPIVPVQVWLYPEEYFNPLLF